MLHSLNATSKSGHSCFAFLAPFGQHLLPSACCLFPRRCGQSSLPRRFAIRGSRDLLDYPVTLPIRARSLRITWGCASSPLMGHWPALFPAAYLTQPPLSRALALVLVLCLVLSRALALVGFISRSFPRCLSLSVGARRILSLPSRSPSPPMFPLSLPRPFEHPAMVFRSSRIPLPLLSRQPPMP